jgi:DNA repair protein RadA/Sms
VPGSALLIGGDPGVGKSTLLLQIAAGLGAGGAKVAYISGEEATAQIRLRAQRLGLSIRAGRSSGGDGAARYSATLKAERPDVVMIDSIQTLWSDTLPAAPGTVDAGARLRSGSSFASPRARAPSCCLSAM